MVNLGAVRAVVGPGIILVALQIQLLGECEKSVPLRSSFQYKPLAGRTRKRSIGAKKVPVFGNPDLNRVSPSSVERLNLTLRMSSRRLTRLTTGAVVNQRIAGYSRQ